MKAKLYLSTDETRAFARFHDGRIGIATVTDKQNWRAWAAADLLVLWPAFLLARLFSARFRQRWPRVSFLSAATGRVYRRKGAPQRTLVHELRHVVQLHRHGRLRHFLLGLWPPSMVRLEAEAYFFDGSTEENTVFSLHGGAYVMLLGRRRVETIVHETFQHWNSKIEARP